MFGIWKYFCNRIQQRWVFGIMAFLGLVNAYTMRICLSLALTEMVLETNTTKYSDDTCDFLTNNLTKSSRNISTDIYDWDEELQGMILSSFFWGYVLTQIPGGMVAEKYGGKYVLAFGIVSTSILTLLTPLALQSGGSTAMIIIRFVIGLGEGMTFPAANALLSQWAPPSERSKMGSFVFSGNPVGAMIGSAISGLLIHHSSIGWHSVFYVFGSFGILWFILWVILCYNNPTENPFISEKEKEYLHEAMKEHTHRNIPPIPWRHILKSLPLWALTVSFIGQDWGYFTLIADLPKYMSNVLKFSIRENGLFLALPILFLWLSTFFASWLADWLINKNKISRTNVRRIFNTVGSLGPGISLVSASYAGCDRVLVVALFVLGMTLNGAAFPGMKVNALDLSPNYSGTVLALANGIGALSGIVTPYVVGVLAPNQTATEWRLVFWIVFAFYFLTNLIFLIFSSGEVQYWNDPEFLMNEKKKRKTAVVEEPRKSKISVT